MRDGRRLSDDGRLGIGGRGGVGDDDGRDATDLPTDASSERPKSRAASLTSSASRSRKREPRVGATSPEEALLQDDGDFPLIG